MTRASAHAMPAPDLAALVSDGARLFDDARFFEAHEAWEAHWLRETDEVARLLLQGLIQIAAGFHKLIDKNAPEPAARLLARGLAKLDRCSLDLGAAVPALAVFREGVSACVRDLEQGRFDRASIPRCLPLAAPGG